MEVIKSLKCLMIYSEIIYNFEILQNGIRIVEIITARNSPNKLWFRLAFKKMTIHNFFSYNNQTFRHNLKIRKNVKIVFSYSYIFHPHNFNPITNFNKKNGLCYTFQKSHRVLHELIIALFFSFDNEMTACQNLKH